MIGNAFIINRSMGWNIIGVGGFFFVLLLVLLYIFEHADITALRDILHLQLGEVNGLSPYELTLIFYYLCDDAFLLSVQCACF